jgi:hypothetical protein
MMNHLEQLVAEWLQYNRYFVRVSVHVGPRTKGGHEGQLDVVGINTKRQHLVHVECSLDALSAAKRESRFTPKFERGRRFINEIFDGISPLPSEIDQVALLQLTSGKNRKLGGGRLMTVRELIREIYSGLEGTSPVSKAVPSHLPLLRTLQLAAYAGNAQPSEHRLVRC